MGTGLRFFFKIFFFIWFALIVFLSISPNSLGEQSFIHRIAITESRFFQHIFGYFVLGAITFLSFERKHIWYYLWGYFFLGIIFEIIQFSIPSRTYNINDILANGFGLQAIAWIIYLKRNN